MSSASIPAMWLYRNESGSLGTHMGTGAERGLKDPHVVIKLGCRSSKMNENKLLSFQKLIV
jgi:hypothetical protein